MRRIPIGHAEALSEMTIPLEASSTLEEIRGRCFLAGRVFRDSAATRLRVQMDGNTLSLTPFERSDGPIRAGVMSKYLRVE